MRGLAHLNEPPNNGEIRVSQIKSNSRTCLLKENLRIWSGDCSWRGSWWPAAAAGRSTSPPGWTGGSAQGETPPGFGLKTKPSKKGQSINQLFTKNYT